MSVATTRFLTSAEQKRLFERGEPFSTRLSMDDMQGAIIVVKHVDQPTHRQAKPRHTFEVVGYNTAVSILEDGEENVQIRFVRE